MATAIDTNQLQPGDTVLIRGHLTYGRLVHKIQGKELEERNRKAKYPITKPYTTATICDAQVLAKDPNSLSLLEQWAKNRFFVSSMKESSGYSFSANNKGKNTPWIGQQTGTGVVEQVYPEGELARGLDVTLVLSVFRTKINNGVSLDGVIVHEPIRLFSTHDPKSVLAPYGLEFIEKPKPEEYPEGDGELNLGESGYDSTIPMMDNAPNPDLAPSTPSDMPQMAQMPQNPYANPNPNEGIRYNPQERGY